jgi:hypothetical protein
MTTYKPTLNMWFKNIVVDLHTISHKKINLNIYTKAYFMATFHLCCNVILWSILPCFHPPVNSSPLLLFGSNKGKVHEGSS